MRVRVSIRTIWATRFAAGLSAAISASLRFPLQSLSPPLAGARCALRLPKSTPRRAEVPDTMPDARFALLATALRAALVADLAAHRLAPHPRAVLAALVRALLRSAPALRSAPRRAHRGQRRHRLRQRAAHDCLRLPPHRPLNRRGGSDSPASPASMQQDWPFRTARGGLGSHTRRTCGAWCARLPMSRLRCPEP